MIELYQLEHLLAIAKHGTLSKAAEDRHLSQSALSRSMQRLEAELQVNLFERKKNRIELNANGELAVRYAEKVLEQVQDMISQVRALDWSNRSISVGSCAPAPLWEISPLLSSFYPDLAISSDLKNPDKLLQGLLDGTYQIIVMPYEVIETECFVYPYRTERLFFSLPLEHPLANCSELSFQDLDGETILLYSHIGFWKEVHQKKMPTSRFLLQEERFAFQELVKASALPSFISDISLKREGMPPNRVIVPISDPEATVTYYCVCLQKEKRRFLAFLKKLEKLK